ncbi:hypothetical protein C8R47DRAFT_1254820 [Mycena vitilis]|nr:hypothetical protein C8R47DRAFT_1254820 [Mycena vitilis]
MHVRALRVWDDMPACSLSTPPVSIDGTLLLRVRMSLVDSNPQDAIDGLRTPAACKSATPDLTGRRSKRSPAAPHPPHEELLLLLVYSRIRSIMPPKPHALPSFAPTPTRAHPAHRPRTGAYTTATLPHRLRHEGVETHTRPRSQVRSRHAHPTTPHALRWAALSPHAAACRRRLPAPRSLSPKGHTSPPHVPVPLRPPSPPHPLHTHIPARAPRVAQLPKSTHRSCICGAPGE